MRARRADIDADGRQRNIVLAPERIVLDRAVVVVEIVVVIVVGVVGMQVHDVAAVEVVGKRVAGLLIVVVGHSLVSRAELISRLGSQVNTAKPRLQDWSLITMTENGLITLPSSHGAKETIDRLEAEVEAKGMTVFARIDHAAGAKTAGLALRPTEVLIFGNAKGGTPLMQAAQTIGIDLPLKALAWEDADGKVVAVL